MESDFWKRLKEVTPRMGDPQRVKLCMKATGVKQPSVSRWKTGEVEPSRKNARKIAQRLGANPAYLQDGDEPKVKPDPGSPEDQWLIEFLGFDEGEKRDAVAYVLFRRQSGVSPE